MYIFEILGTKFGEIYSQATLSCLLFPSLYHEPKKANHRNSDQMHAGLASEGVIPPFRRNLALGITRGPEFRPLLRGYPATVTKASMKRSYADSATCASSLCMISWLRCTDLRRISSPMTILEKLSEGE